MREVKVLKEELLIKLRQNRDKHEETYKDAMDQYRRDMEAVLFGMIDDMREKKEIKHFIEMDVPECHLDDYDGIIGLLEMSTDIYVDLSDYEYKRYVLDRWDWQESFAKNTSSYARRKVRSY